MYVTIENYHYCITSHEKVELHPPLPFIYGTTSPVSHGISVECNGIDPSKLKSSTNTTDFRPTRLIRTSDMTVVPGSEAINGYCALSYPWEWSGDVVYIESKDGDNYRNDTTTNTSSQSFSYGRKQQKIILDHGEHTHIARPTLSLDCLNNSSTKKKWYERNDKLQYPLVFDTAQSIFDSVDEPAVRHVTFTEIIKQLCWMFEIDYIWYDQLCIDQLNLKDKQNEIRQMHHIYGNAQFTMVMIPEMQFVCPHPDSMMDKRPTETAIQNCIQQIATSKWSNRAWTFEEAVLSKRLLFVGRDVHLWSDTIISTEKPWQLPFSLYTHNPRHKQGTPNEKKDNSNGDDSKDNNMTSRPHNINDESYVRFVQNICSITSDTISASSALWHIHRGESTQDHDKIFALANIFPRLMDDMNDFSYNQPLLPLMTRFYENLIRHDLSVLCFGKEATHGDVMYHYGTVDQGTQMIITPSWTGVAGSHMIQTPTYPTPPTSSFGRYYITDGYLTLHSKATRVFIEPLDRCPHASLPYIYGVRNVGPVDASLVALMDNASYRQIVSYGLTPTHWLERNHSDQRKFITTTISATGITRKLSYDNNIDNSITAWFSLTTEADIKKCVILMDVQFNIGMEGFKVYPIVIKSGEYYSSIGIVFARNLQLLFDPDNTEIDEFIIR